MEPSSSPNTNPINKTCQLLWSNPTAEFVFLFHCCQYMIFTDSVGHFSGRVRVTNEPTIAAEHMMSVEYRAEERITRFICSSIHPKLHRRILINYSFQILIYHNSVSMSTENEVDRKEKSPILTHKRLKVNVDKNRVSQLL